MKKVYHLSTCTTNQRILKELNLGEDVELHDIKQKNIEPEILDFMQQKVGKYEALFSKRAIKFRSLGLHEQELDESDYRRLMLEEYTFLKRPFIIFEDNVFVGNAAKTIDAAKKAYHG
jgi:arsenate reductase (glutaredoxin)